MCYATCPECGFVLPPREKQNHEAKPTEVAILSGQATTTRYEVTNTHYFSHLKRGAADDAPRSMRVDYMVGWRTRKSEWICFEHSGYARQHTVAWWKQRSPDPCLQPPTRLSSGSKGSSGSNSGDCHSQRFWG